MQVRAAAIQSGLLFGLLFILCYPGEAQQSTAPIVPAFDVQLSLSQTAAARLNPAKKFRVFVGYYGSPAPGVRADSPLGFGWNVSFMVQGKSQTVHVFEADPHMIANIVGPVHISIRITSDYGSSLSCDTFDGTANDVAAGPVPLRCGLTSKAKSEGIGIVSFPGSSAADVYAIYSLLLPGGPLDKTTPTNARSWAVADTTVNITDMSPAVPPDGQLKAPPDNKKAFEQVLTDFEFRKYERFQLTSGGFAGSAPELIDEQRVQQIRQSGRGGIVFFSAVYFNNAQTAALVYVNQWCANLCAAGQWVYLEKKDGQWVRRSGISHGGA